MVYSKYHEYQQFIVGMEVQQADFLAANSNRWLWQSNQGSSLKDTGCLTVSMVPPWWSLGSSPNPNTATITKHAATLHPSPPPSRGSAHILSSSFHLQLFHICLLPQEILFSNFWLTEIRLSYFLECCGKCMPIFPLTSRLTYEPSVPSRSNLSSGSVLLSRNRQSK